MKTKPRPTERNQPERPPRPSPPIPVEAGVIGTYPVSAGELVKIKGLEFTVECVVDLCDSTEIKLIRKW